MKIPMRLGTSLSLLLALAVAANTAAIGPRVRQDGDSGPAVNTKAPNFKAVDQDGVSFKLSDYRGKVVVLDFWGFW